MKPILELHVSGLGEGETPTFRIEPVGLNAGKPVFLSPAEFSTVSESSTAHRMNRRRIGTRSGRRF